jgi:hypothetical protein
MVLHSGDTYDVRGNLMAGKVSGMLEFRRNSSTVHEFVLTISGARAANIRFTRINSEGSIEQAPPSAWPF